MAIKALLQKWDLRFVELAELIASWSKDPSTKVGAVIANSQNKILGTGYNGFPVGIDDSQEFYEDRELKYSRIIHAEVNAILNSKQDLNGASIYLCALPPCSSCTKQIIQAGIKKVVCPAPVIGKWNDEFKISKKMYDEAGIEVILYE